ASKELFNQQDWLYRHFVTCAQPTAEQQTELDKLHKLEEVAAVVISWDGPQPAFISSAAQSAQAPLPMVNSVTTNAATGTLSEDFDSEGEESISEIVSLAAIAPKSEGCPICKALGLRNLKHPLMKCYKLKKMFQLYRDYVGSSKQP